MTIIVTGGAGFIGSALVRRLNAQGQRVVTIDKLTYAGNPDNLAGLKNPELHRFEQVDICDRAAIKRIYAEVKPRAVYHLAAESHVDRSIDSPAPFIDTNVTGTLVLLEAAVDHYRNLDGTAKTQFRHLQVSTDEVYGELGATGLFDEDSPYRPNSPYAASKAAADHLTRAFGRTYGLPVLVTNCGNNYGPYQFPEKLIPLTILNALEGKSLPVYGKGEQVRDWIHVEDHVGALQLVVEKGRPGETYLIGARGEQRNIDLVHRLCAILDELVPKKDGSKYAEQITFVTDRPGHDARYAIDPAKVERELDWKPAYDLAEGLKATVQWYLDNAAWCRRATQTYDRRRIGLG
ncbi:dTDP-glucose 4,6-dehydratase [uncultured Ferrovibrio sp.]|jgi:dTDP-glucose 4,6-dehydratase|uniref:dTDP-glucose 4,6-dehydratase n=1 Tax=uncultured Ferrovibrio sp. TaxID=1576913 RepID=UPI00263375C4|nr:dTDP-glucose 4,6-dehydratase [uncultured Ferrovibrio sp.]